MASRSRWPWAVSAPGAQGGRVKARAAKLAIAAGTDPMAERKATKIARQLAVENAFAAVAKKWWETWKAARSESHTLYVWRRLEADVFPVIGARPVSEIEAPELVAMTKRTAARGALDIAKRNLQTVARRSASPSRMAWRRATLPPTSNLPTSCLHARRRTMPAWTPASCPSCCGRSRSSTFAVTRTAIKLIALTFVRTSELIGARWDEFDLDAARWDIPASG